MSSDTDTWGRLALELGMDRRNELRARLERLPELDDELTPILGVPTVFDAPPTFVDPAPPTIAGAALFCEDTIPRRVLGPLPSVAPDDCFESEASTEDLLVPLGRDPDVLPLHWAAEPAPASGWRWAGPLAILLMVAAGILGLVLLHLP